MSVDLVGFVNLVGIRCGLLIFNVSAPTEKANILFLESVEMLSDLIFWAVSLKLKKLLKSYAFIPICLSLKIRQGSH